VADIEGPVDLDGDGLADGSRARSRARRRSRARGNRSAREADECGEPAVGAAGGSITYSTPTMLSDTRSPTFCRSVPSPSTPAPPIMCRSVTLGAPATGTRSRSIGTV
jgi:hypothetical protein